MAYDNTAKSFMIIDLGNIHNFLPYADSRPDLFNEFEIVAFADHHFNGYGINERCIRNVSLHVSGSSRNAADCAMIWFIAKNTVNKKCRFMILTKDKGFREIENLCLQSGSEARFFNSSDEFIEYYLNNEVIRISQKDNTSTLTDTVI
jgi:hypothetical protein